jgi:HEPN domain-containing protein
MTEPHEAWMAMAEDDLNFAKVGLREKFYSQVCFLSQQVIEKVLKGYLVHGGKTYPKTHKLIDLYRLCNADFLGPFKNKIKLIDEFYIPTRYPDGVPGSLPERASNETDAKEALKTAEDIMQICLVYMANK